MKHIFTYTLSMLIGASLYMHPVCAETENNAEATEGETAGNAAPEKGSKEWKRAMLIATQQQTAAEYKDIRLLTNLLKKAKNERDYNKINKMADDILKKYSALYIENTPATVNGMEITVEDLKPSHIKLGSKRKKLYKDFMEFSEKQRNKQQQSNWDSPQESSSKKKKKEKKPEVSINMGTLDKVREILRVNQEEAISEIDEEYEEKNSQAY